jgi:phage FluMu protein Com
MPEFRCTNCQKLLRTPPGSEGKQAKCPQCGALQEIPAQSAFAPPPREPEFAPIAQAPAAPGAGSSNPFQSPTAAGAIPQTVPRGFQPTSIDLGETLSRTWQIYRDRFGACLGGGLLAWLLMAVSGGVAGTLSQGMALAIGGDEGQIAGALFQQVLAQGVYAFFLVGIARYMLQIARGEPAEIGQLFSGGSLLPQAFAIQMILFLGTVVGAILLLVPGIIFWLMFSQSPFMLVDQRANVGQSLSLSRAAMKGNKLTLFGLYLVTGLLGLAIMVFTCFIGLLGVVPFVMLLNAVVYLGVTGQQTMLDVHADPRSERAFSAFGGRPPEAPAL